MIIIGYIFSKNKLKSQPPNTFNGVNYANKWSQCVSYARHASLSLSRIKGVDILKAKLMPNQILSGGSSSIKHKMMYQKWSKTL